MKKFMAEFKKFVSRGNVIDMAVGVVVGGAFGKITTSLVNDVIMPCIGKIVGGLNVTEWKVILTPAKEAVVNEETGEIVSAAVTEVAIKYGNLIQTMIDFLLIAFSIFVVVYTINCMRARAEKRRKKNEPAPAPAAPPAPPADVVLLTEIRDLLKEKKEN